MKIILSLIISGALAVSGFGQTRNVLVGTNNTVVQPTNFWSADASNARSGLGLGSAATNPATAFQPSSSTLTNLANGNAGDLTNLKATNIVGTLGIFQGGTGATNSSDARSNLGLGTASTNASSAFQSSSATLSNLALGNGGSLTNLQAANLIGAIPLSNIPSVTFTGITGTLSVAQGGTGATNASDARQNLGSTTIGDAVFTATNTENARTALSLGTAATSSITDFQPANANLTNLSTNDGSLLSNIPISGVVNLQSNLDTKLATNGNASGLTSITAANITGTVALASNITGTAALATNVTGTVALANGGTGATNAASARTSLGATTVGDNLFTLINPSAIRFLRLNADNTATALSASDFRTALSLGTAATNAETAFQPASTNLTTLSGNNGFNITNITLSNVVGLQAGLNTKLNTNGDAVSLTNFPDLLLRTNGSAAGLTNFPTGLLTTNGNGAGLTNLTAANITGTVGLASNVSGLVAITNGGSGATTAGGARTNLGLGATNSPTFAAVNADSFITGDVTYGSTGPSGFGRSVDFEDGAVSGIFNFGEAIEFQSPSAAATTRTNLGLGWSALTNSNAGTGLVSVNTNGDVVSPTNFWQVAPISTTVQYQTNVVSTSTNAATNSRNLFLYSLATSVSGITNTITLPTNPATTFEGDRATIIHGASTTNAVTAIRQLGAATNLITLNQYEEAVLFIYRSGVWSLADNISYVEPIYFSGTNAAANAAASRTNLGISWSGLTNTNASGFRSALELSAAWLTNTNVTNFRTAIGLGATNEVSFSVVNIGTYRLEDQVDGLAFVEPANEDTVLQLTEDGNPVYLNGSYWNDSTVRANLGLPLPALTNTNNANFQAAVFATNTIPTNSANVNSIGFNTAVAWMEVTVSTNGTNHSFRIPLFR
jgi:hypothetical protein